MDINSIKTGGLIRSMMYVIIAFTCINMGKGGDSSNMGSGPIFTPLDDNEKSYKASVIDNGKAIEVKDISFTGKTKISGIKKEGQNVTITIDFGKIKELIIHQSSYCSKNFGNQEFILAEYTQQDGIHVPNLLFPKNIVISAVGIKPNVEYTWNLRDIEKIIFGQSTPEAVH